MKSILKMIKSSKLLGACLGLGLWASASFTASASDFVFDLTPYTGDPASVTVTVHQQDINTLRFTVDQLDPVNYGDLRGLFFHVNESIIDPTALSFSFVAAVENDTLNSISPSFTSAVGLNSINNVGGSDNKVTPLGNYDVGFEFGSSGAGTDDIKSVVFDVAKVGGLDMMTFMPINKAHFMAARVMSLRPNGGSSKLSCCTTTVAEPEMAGLFVLAFGTLLWRRRFSS